jgi:hypothetical protein
MATSYHVHGAARVLTGTGTSEALEPLGFSEDGVTITPRAYMRPVYTDLGGPEVPAEFQNMRQDCDIDVNLIVWDNAVLDKVLAKLAGDATAAAFGVMGTPGRLVGSSGATGGGFRLAILFPSGSTENPFDFPKVTLKDSFPVKVGTVISTWRLKFYAWPFLPGSAVTGKDVVLVDRSATFVDP